MTNTLQQHSREAAEDLPARSTSIVSRAPRVSLTLADFDIIRRIGDGSYSEVLQVRMKATGSEYALKMVDKHLIVRHRMVAHVKMERNILDACDYPGIAQLYFTFQDEASLYLGLELCPNGELYDQIRVAGRLPVERARFYAAEVVLMLEYLQGVGVVHRDLKPENLLLDAGGHLKLVDFGSALQLQADGQEPERCEGQRRTSLVGTADYVAPEVLSNDEVGFAVDLWALGCIIFQMLVGKPPFKAASEYLTFQRIAECEYSFPENCSLPAPAEDIVSRLLVLRPSARLGVGEGGLLQLKRHSFFKGLDWENVRNRPAPAFAPPQLAADTNNIGLDWEMTSLTAALPLQYSYGGERLPAAKAQPGQPPDCRHSDLASHSVYAGSGVTSAAAHSSAESVPVNSSEQQVSDRAQQGSSHSPPAMDRAGSWSSQSTLHSVPVRHLSPFAGPSCQAADTLSSDAAVKGAASQPYGQTIDECGT